MKHNRKSPLGGLEQVSELCYTLIRKLRCQKSLDLWNFI